MSNKYSLITEKRINELKDKRKTAEQARKIKNKMMAKNAMIGLGLGLSTLLCNKVKLKFAIPAGIVLGAAGVAYAAYVDKDYVDDGTIKDLKDDIIKAAEDNFNAARESSNILFSAHVDDFYQEHSIYDTAYDLIKNTEDLNAVSSFIKTTEISVKDTTEKLDKLEREYADLCSMEPDKSLSEDKDSDMDSESVPLYGTTNGAQAIKRRKEDVFSNISSLKKKYSKERQELESASRQFRELSKIVKDASMNLKHLEDGVKVTMCNRVARDHYKKKFIDPLEEILKSAKSLPTDIESYSEEIAYEKRLRGLLDLIAIIGEDHKDIGSQYESLMKEKIKADNLSRTKTDMTYATAPYYKIFEISVGLSQISDDAIRDYVEEIKNGAEEDVFVFGGQKGRWLVERNFSNSWMFTLGDFSEKDARRLEYLMEGYLDFKIDYNTDLDEANKAYRQYAKDHHEDVGYNNGTFQETSALMKKLRTYIGNRDEYLRKEDSDVANE